MEGEGLGLVDASHLCWGVGRDVFRADELYATILNEDAREEALTRCSSCCLCCWRWRKSSIRTRRKCERAYNTDLPCGGESVGEVAAVHKVVDSEVGVQLAELVVELFDVCPLAVDEVYVVGVDALDEAVCLVEVCVRRERDGDDRGLELELALVHGRDLPGVLLDVRTEGASMQ